MYQVGSLQVLEEDAPRMSNYGMAVKHAIERSMSEGCFYGIWTGQEEGSELLAIVYEGEVFHK